MSDEEPERAARVSRVWPSIDRAQAGHPLTPLRSVYSRRCLVYLPAGESVATFRTCDWMNNSKRAAWLLLAIFGVLGCREFADQSRKPDTTETNQGGVGGQDGSARAAAGQPSGAAVGDAIERAGAGGRSSGEADDSQTGGDGSGMASSGMPSNNATGEGGMLGEIDGSPETAGGTFGGDEPTLLPTCEIFLGVNSQATRGLGLSRTFDGGSIQLYTWDRLLSAGIVRWSDSLTPASWTDWRCFDVAPNVTRIAALNLLGGPPEVFMATADDVLLVRRDSFDGWTPWLPFSLPQSSTRIRGLAAVGATPTNPVPRVYLADGFRLFVRRKLTEETYGPYGSWWAFPPNGATLVAALARADLTHQVLILDAEYKAQTARQAPGDDFGDWEDVATFPGQPVDLTIGESDAQRVIAFGLDASGTVWTLEVNKPKAAWTHLVDSVGLSKIVAIAAGPGAQLFGIDAYGQSYQLGGAEWQINTSYE